VKKVFRWGCIALSLVTLCAWALLLHQATEPWKLIGVNESSDAEGASKGSEKKAGKEIASTASRADVAPPGEGDRTPDSLVVEQEKRQQTDSFDIHDARLLFIGTGPMAKKSRHHRAKKSTDTDADSFSEDKEETSDTVPPVNDNAAELASTMLARMFASSGSLTSTLRTTTLPTADVSVTTSFVKDTTQSVVERLTTSSVPRTITDTTRRIISTAPTYLQSPITIVQSPLVGSIPKVVGSITPTLQTSTLQTPTLQAPTLQTSTPQLPNAVSPIAPTISTSGSPISPTIASPSSSAPPASSLPQTFAVSPTLAPSTGPSLSTAPSMEGSSALTTSVSTTLSSTLGSTSLAPKTHLGGR
jgi:hypothetical protein